MRPWTAIERRQFAAKLSVRAEIELEATKRSSDVWLLPVAGGANGLRDE